MASFIAQRDRILAGLSRGSHCQSQRSCPSAPPDNLRRLIPPGKLVVVGDNAAWSQDSRQLGYFPGDRLLGVVVHRLTERSAKRAVHRSGGAGGGGGWGSNPGPADYESGFALPGT